MPAAEEAAGGEVSPTPPPSLPYAFIPPSWIRWRDRGVPSAAPPSRIRPRPEGARALSPSLGPSSGHLGTPKPYSSSLIPPLRDLQVQGGGDRGPMEQVLSAVPSPGSGQWDPGALCPCPPDPERARVGA